MGNGCEAKVVQMRQHIHVLGALVLGQVQRGELPPATGEAVLDAVYSSQEAAEAMITALFAELDEAREVIATLRQQLTERN